MIRSRLTLHRRPDSATGRHRVVAVTLAAASLLAVGTGIAAASTDAASKPGTPVTPRSYYLALGDSVPFGFREANNTPAPDYSSARNFTGYPEVVATSLGLHLANAACPGETSSSFIDQTAQSNGCENSPGSPGGYRSVYPLHVGYKGSQLDYAVSFLKSHPSTRLVTLMIGANDGLLCQETTPDMCASEIPAVLQKIAKNVRTILDAIRNTAGYTGQIVIPNYYSLDYTDANASANSRVLNNVLTKTSQPYDVTIADDYGLFQKAAAQAGGDTCAAGLLTTLTSGGCGVHPSIGGQALLAQATARAIRR